jgi:hypothetical protein
MDQNQTYGILKKANSIARNKKKNAQADHVNNLKFINFTKMATVVYRALATIYTTPFIFSYFSKTF